MPKLGGPATAAGLLEMHPDLPLVFTSGYSAAGTEVPNTCGNARYLQKPYSPTTLGRLVRETLDQRRSQAHRAGINNENQHLIEGPTRLDGPVL
jgi:FixJ family two-component response regulator